MKLIQNTVLDAKYLGLNVKFCRSMEVFKAKKGVIDQIGTGSNSDKNYINLMSWRLDEVMID